MTTSYYAERQNLFVLCQSHPTWAHAQFAHVLDRSRDWVKKWRHRFQPVMDLSVMDSTVQEICQGHSRARTHPPAKVDPFIEACILDFRDHPPEGLRRVPGPVALLYYLQHDPQLALWQHLVPKAKSTIYRLLKRNQRIAPRPKREHEPMERPALLQHWQMDFKDVSSVPAEPDDPLAKQQHVVETCNLVDMGSSIVLDAHVHEAFTAEEALRQFVVTLQRYGCPQRITVDRDPRWVGSAQGADFPSALLRLLACVGINAKVCDPHHPQQNAFVERYHRTYQEECLAIDHPRTLEQAREVTHAFMQHYNEQRPHQGLSCGNRPPRTAFPTLPVLPALPLVVDPDEWLQEYHGQHIKRKVDARGMIRLDLKGYYVGKELKGQQISAQIDAHEKCLHVYHDGQCKKTCPLKGIVGYLMTLDDFIEHSALQARADARLHDRQQRRKRTGPHP
jgi:transposase InsO family protein